MAESFAQTAYLAADGYVDELAQELGSVTARYGRLLVAPGPVRKVAWAENVWHSPRLIPIGSIAEAVRALRGLQRNWSLYSHAHHRRARLVLEQLPHVSARRIAFPNPLPLRRWAPSRSSTPTPCSHLRRARARSRTGKLCSSRTGSRRRAGPI